jgi:hypothetical protein
MSARPSRLPPAAGRADPGHGHHRLRQGAERGEDGDRRRRRGGAELRARAAAGFASTFLDAMRRAAQIRLGYKAANVFCFSWPANGKVNLDDYQADRVDAEKSGQAIADALAQFLATIKAIAPAQRPTIHVVCHSMGAFAFRAAVQAIRELAPDLIQTRALRGRAADGRRRGRRRAVGCGGCARARPARRTTAYIAGGDLALLLPRS